MRGGSWTDCGQIPQIGPSIRNLVDKAVVHPGFRRVGFGLPEGAAEATTDLLVVTSAGPKARRKFLRAFRCLPARRLRARTPGTPVLSRLDQLLAVAGPAILLVAAAVSPVRPVAAITIAAGWLGLWLTRSPVAITWAAVLPVAVLLTWPWLLGTDAPLGEAACQAPLSVIAVRRIVAALVILGLVALLARAHRSSRSELGLGRPTGPEASVALAGLLLLVAAGLVVGPAIAQPFFGDLSFPVPPGALLPAVLFGLSNGILEEVAYRGSMQAWLGRLAPIGVAIGIQGLVFGIVHAGPDVVALLPVHVLMLAGVGVAGGVVRACRGSLAIPIGIHVGADIALYFGLACRPMS